MPAVVTAVQVVLATLGNVAYAVGFSGGGFMAAAAVGASVLVAGTAAMTYGLRSLTAIDMPDQDSSRATTMRSTTEGLKVVYGEAVVSGPVAFMGVANTDNKDLYHSVVLAGHEVDSIQSVNLDSNEITNAQINSGAAGGGNVTAELSVRSDQRRPPSLRSTSTSEPRLRAPTATSQRLLPVTGLIIPAKASRILSPNLP